MCPRGPQCKTKQNLRENQKGKKEKKSCCGNCSTTQWVTRYTLQTIHLHLQVFIVMSHCSDSRLRFLLPTSASLPSPLQTCLSSRDMAHSVSFCLPCHTIFAYHKVQVCLCFLLLAQGEEPWAGVWVFSCSVLMDLGCLVYFLSAQGFLPG